MPGQTIHIQSPDNAVYEVVVPETAAAGDSINILVNSPVHEDSKGESADASGHAAETSPSSDGVSGVAAVAAVEEAPSSESVLRSRIESGLQTVFTKLSQIDEEYKISEKAREFDRKLELTATAQHLDQKYEISSRTTALVTPLLVRAREFEEAHQLKERAAAGILAAERSVLRAKRSFLVLAKQIDEKYAISNKAQALKGRFVAVSDASVSAALDILRSIEVILSYY